MQCFGHQISNAGKRSFNVFSIVILQICFIGLVFSFGVLLACRQDVYACIGSNVLKSIAGVATVIIDTISWLKVPQQLTNGFTVMLTAGYKAALYGNASGCGDDLHLHSIKVLVLTGTKASERFSPQE